ncbi:hypothetical protein XENOCAPTIV_001055 [Xenoophorus captivus]|uniref:Uncharacterized protein n=1 Tax=Xenoophorus captivus TaxID=1517983 RepID=A0ABV0QFS5_9TELE
MFFLLRGSTTVHWRSIRGCHGKCHLLWGDEAAALRESAYSMMAYLPFSFARLLSFFSKRLSVTISKNILLHKFLCLCKHRLSIMHLDQLFMLISHMCRLTPQLLPPLLTVMSFYLLCLCCVKHAYVCFLHAKADLVAYLHPLLFSRESFYSRTCRCQMGSLANPLEIRREFRLIPFRFSVTSLSDWLYVTFSRVCARLSSGNTPRGRISDQNNATC